MSLLKFAATGSAILLFSTSVYATGSIALGESKLSNPRTIGDFFMVSGSSSGGTHIG